MCPMRGEEEEEEEKEEEKKKEKRRKEKVIRRFIKSNHPLVGQVGHPTVCAGRRYP